MSAQLYKKVKFRKLIIYFPCRYLNEVTEVRKAHKKLGLNIAQHKVGNKVLARFLGVNAVTNDWQYELEKTKVLAVAKSTLVGKAKPPKVGSAQECLVLWVDYSNELVYISNKQVDVAHASQEKRIPSNLVGKSGINAKVLLKTEQLYVCSLKKGSNPLIYCPLRLHFNDFENSACANLKEGDFCKVAFIHNKLPIAVPDNTWKLWHDIKKKRKTKMDLDNEPKVKKAKIVAANEEAAPAHEIKIAEKQQDKPEKKQKQKQETMSDKSDVPANKKKKKQAKIDGILFYEDKTPNQIVVVENNADLDEEETLPQKTAETKPAPKLPGIRDFWDADLSLLNSNNKALVSSDDDETDDQDAAPQVGQKKKKLTAAEKFKLQRAEETRLREIEAKYADPNHLPESIDQFDRLVLSEPNNSKHWINYMVYHLQSAEIEKARAVARRAIKAISYRENSEQLNIWVSLLNLELRYGNKEAFDEVLKEAITYNDPLKVYLRALEILCDAKKIQELIEMINLVTKKFKAQPEIWRATANAYFSIEMHERAQQLLHKALTCLPERERKGLVERQFL